jgi:hypothetical protein
MWWPWTYRPASGAAWLSPGQGWQAAAQYAKPYSEEALDGRHPWQASGLDTLMVMEEF